MCLPLSSPLFQMKVLEDDILSALAKLRRHINPLESPLYRLPPDLFPEVASHLASETDLVTATHVSYHLRSTLLCSPTLWSYLDFESGMRARTFFERSGQTPLHIDMAMDVTQTVDSLAELRRQSKRIATLKLRHWSIQKMFLSESLPSLRRLEISFNNYYDDDWDEEWDTVWAPMWGPIEKATSWTFPSLTSLIVYGLSPISFHTPCLTRLKFWDQERIKNADMLIRFLDNYPLLEHINISYADGLPSKHDLVISLPSLRTYTQTSFNEVCSLTVLNALSLPPSCSVTLRSHYDSETAVAYDMLPPFKNPDYLAEIKRVKLRTAHDANGNEVAGALELVNAKRAKLCSERMAFEEEGHGGEDRAYNVAHLEFLGYLDGRSVEILCIDGYASQDVRGTPAEFLKEVLSFGNVRTLILSHSAVVPCLSALDEHPGTCRWFLPINTLTIHPDPDRHGSYIKILLSLLNIAQKRRVVGFPFKSVSLFLHGDLEWRWGPVMDKLRSCVGELEVVAGEDVLDWDVDKDFLDGLGHLQKHLDVQWD